MFGIILGVLTIILGAKAFSAKGLPLTKSKNLTGRIAKGIGAICVLLGVLFLVDGLFGAAGIIAMLSKSGRFAENHERVEDEKAILDVGGNFERDWQGIGRPIVLVSFLIVQRNELSCFPQPFFPSPSVAVAGDSIPLLPPFGEIDNVPLRLRGRFGGEYDLQ